jgi:hypothetical protein
MGGDEKKEVSATCQLGLLQYFEFEKFILGK